jgi:hypothetical protein
MAYQWGAVAQGEGVKELPPPLECGGLTPLFSIVFLLLSGETRNCQKTGVKPPQSKSPILSQTQRVRRLGE